MAAQSTMVRGEKGRGGGAKARETVGKRKSRWQQVSNSSANVSDRSLPLRARLHKPTCPLRNLEKLCPSRKLAGTGKDI